MTHAQSNPTRPYGDEIDLVALIRVLWDGKFLIGGITFAVAVIAVFVSLSMPNIYRAAALLAPNDQDGSGALSALGAQYGGLASLAGINLQSTSTDKTAIGLEILKSRQFIAGFIERHDILVPLMAAEGWDAGSNKLEINPKLYDEATQTWVRKANPPRKVIPSMQEAHERFLESLLVTHDKSTGLVVIAVEHYSPGVAKQWVDWLVEDINASVLQQDVARAEQAIEYLNEQIAATSLAELQSVFFTLIEEQTKTVMLAKVSPEYLLRTLDPAVVPELKARPKRSIIVLLAAFFGGVLGVLIQLFRSPDFRPARRDPA